MKIEIKKLVYSALFATTLFLVGCADAGRDQVVTGSSLVTLDANNSTASAGGTIEEYKWMQVSGIHVNIDNNTNSRITFTAPSVETETVLKFRLRTVEIGGKPNRFRTYDFVQVTVQPNDNEDTRPPVITLNGVNPMRLALGETYVEPGATAQDAVDGDIDVNITGEVDTSTAGTYTVTYTATDSANNVATAERTVIVIDGENNDTNDTTAPVITLNGENPMTINLNETYVEPGATAIDDRDGTLDVNITGDEVDTSKAGTYTVIYTATDSANNVATAERNVTVIDGEDNETNDTTAPVITLNGENPMTINLGETYVDPGATAIDDVDGDVDVTPTGSVDTNNIGSYIITYTATDSSNNVATAERNVTVIDGEDNETNDTTAPVITLNGENPMTINLNETYVEPGATATDDVDGTLDVNITGEVDTSTAGTYTVTYTATDSANNVATAERNVTVIDGEDNETNDTTAPVITLNGENPMTINLNETYVEPGATATDDVDGTLDVNITGDEVDTSKAGTYTVIYTATDRANNVATAERNVTVIDGENNDTNDTAVTSISNGEQYEGNAIVHQVVMNGAANIARSLDFNIEGDGTNPATPNDDFNPVPTFDEDSQVTYADGKVIVPAGVDHFDLKIEAILDEDLNEKAEKYLLTLDNVSALGIIYDRGTL